MWKRRSVPDSEPYGNRGTGVDTETVAASKPATNRNTGYDTDTDPRPVFCGFSKSDSVSYGGGNGDTDGFTGSNSESDGNAARTS